MPIPSYLTPSQMLRRAPLGAIRRAEIPGPEYAGDVSPVTAGGGNTSTGIVTAGGYSVDVGSFVVKVLTGGALGTAVFQFSTDGGLTFGTPQLSESNPSAGDRWDFEIGPSGVVAQFLPGNFVANDTWSFTSTASPLLLDTCAAASVMYAKYAQDTVSSADGLPDIIQQPDEADLQFMAHICRVWLVAGRGTVEPMWWELYREAAKHFNLEARGEIKLFTQPPSDNFVFPMRETARKPFEGFWRW